MEHLQPNFQTQNSQAATIVLEKGKIPPQDIRLEETVLGGMLIDEQGVNEVIDLLHEDVFYKSSHQAIYKAIVSLFEKASPIDILSVAEEMRKSGTLKAVGGEEYLVYLTQQVVSSANIAYHAHIVLQKFIQRSLIKTSNEIIEEAYKETADVFELLDLAETKLFKITEGNLKRSAESATELVAKALKNLTELSKKDQQFSGIPSGFPKIDQITSGWQPTDLIIVAARPAMGKTAFTLTMARNIAIDMDMPVGFFSLEMSSVQLITRLIAAEAKISSEKLRTGKLNEYDWYNLNSRLHELSKAKLYIDDTPALSVFDLRAKARRMVSQFGVKIIIIDYLQLMTIGGSGKGGTREQEVSTISRNLKSLAKELNIPVIALSQLSRSVEKISAGSEHKRPQLSDLRDSGAIEQDADIVTFLYRPSYYKIETWDDKETSPTEDQAEFIIAKHRNGGLGNIRLGFKYGVFSNLEDTTSEPLQEVLSKMNAADFTAMPPPENTSPPSVENANDTNEIPF